MGPSFEMTYVFDLIFSVDDTCQHVYVENDNETNTTSLC